MSAGQMGGRTGMELIRQGAGRPAPVGRVAEQASGDGSGYLAMADFFAGALTGDSLALAFLPDGGLAAALLPDFG